MQSFLTTVKLLGIATAIEFVLAMRLYFVRREATSGNRIWSGVALLLVATNMVLVVSHNQTSIDSLIVSAMLFICANVLFWAAVAAHGSSKPSVVFEAYVPSVVVKGGPYRFVRHPFYLAYTLAFVASSLIAQSWLSWMTVLGLFAAYNLAAGREEGMLSEDEVVGASYRDYVLATWRWIPFVW